uniref:Uncharacterized protein n=1 Tax=Poecilia reticulata TaxID=8081 RepID=A0A3P9PNU7_POERE
RKQPSEPTEPGATPEHVPLPASRGRQLALPHSGNTGKNETNEIKLRPQEPEAPLWEPEAPLWEPEAPLWEPEAPLWEPGHLPPVSGESETSCPADVPPPGAQIKLFL